jgi:hypothetical protein
MPHKNRQLSANEVAALDVIAKYPGLMPKEIATHIDNSQMASSSISACTSRLVWLRKVNRVKVHGSPAYRYYPTNHPLPQGYAQWNNALVKVDRTKSKANGEAPMPPKQAIDTLTRDLFTPPPPPPPPSDKVSLRTSNDMLITIPVGENESVTLTFDRAREVWTRLDPIFNSNK